MGSDDDSETLTAFIYEANLDILENNGKDIQTLNTKAANILRLLGGLFGLYAGAFLLVAEVRLDPSIEVNLGPFINEYVVTSVALLALGYLLAVLAYHKTEFASGPSPEYLQSLALNADSPEEAMQAINAKVPGWVGNNEAEIQTDQMRLFHCKMCIFFSLTSLILGALFAQPLAELETWQRLVVDIGVFLVSSTIYAIVRTTTTSEGLH